MNKLLLRDGEVYFNYLDRIVESVGKESYYLYTSEDILSVSFFNEKYIIDFGCYTVREKDIFIIRLIENNDWDNPIHEKRMENLNNIYNEINNFVEYIYSL